MVKTTYENLDWWYHEQFRRLITQVVRVFGAFNIKIGETADGKPKFQRVPAYFAASMDKQAWSTLNNNSENTTLSAPVMYVHLQSIEKNDQRRQAPYHVDQRGIDERAYASMTGEYMSERGQSYTVQRYMPVPYDVTFSVGMWVSNLDQKFQLLEQILVLFNPGIDFQTSDNPIDWTAIKYMELQSISYSDAPFPVGTDVPMIQVASMDFKVEFWLNPPAKVQRSAIIHTIIQNIVNGASVNPQGVNDVIWDVAGEKPLARVIVTEKQHRIRVDQNIVTLLTHGGTERDDDGNIFDWKPFLDLFGEVRECASEIRLKTTTDIEDFETDIIGVIEEFIEDEPNKIKICWDIDSYPPTTLSPINAVVDPKTVAPGDGLPNPQIGQRYLLTENIAEPIVLWAGGLDADKNDIIEWNGVQWSVIFDASEIDDQQFVMNLSSQRLLVWDGEQWLDAIDGDYFPGYWRVRL